MNGIDNEEKGCEEWGAERKDSGEWSSEWETEKLVDGRKLGTNTYIANNNQVARNCPCCDTKEETEGEK